MLSEALPAQELGPWRPERGRADEPWPGVAQSSLGVAVHGGPRHIALWIISFSNEMNRYVAERHFRSQGTLWGTSAHVRSEEILW